MVEQEKRKGDVAKGAIVTYRSKKRLLNFFSLLFFISLFMSFASPSLILSRWSLVVMVISWSLRQMIQSSIKSHFLKYRIAAVGGDTDDDPEMTYVYRWFLVNWLLVLLSGFLMLAGWVTGYLGIGAVKRLAGGLIAFVTVYSGLVVVRYRKQVKDDLRAEKAHNRRLKEKREKAADDSQI